MHFLGLLAHFVGFGDTTPSLALGDLLPADHRNPQSARGLPRDWLRPLLRVCRLGAPRLPLLLT
jgi:hypothetical protein